MGLKRGQGSGWLVFAGVLSATAAILHIAVIMGGPDWYRFFGAGEAMAQMAESGSAYPTVVTACIAVILAVWAACAFSGAGLMVRLPLLRTALFLIGAIYLLRGLILIPALILGTADAFIVWSSLIVLVYGLTYAIGTWKAWPRLSSRR